MDYIKTVVGHAGSRDHYQVALSFYEANLLDTFVTDFFVPDAISSILSHKRGVVGIPYYKTKISREAFWEFIREKAPFLPTPGDYTNKDSSISRSCLKIALKNNANLFLYSYYAYDAFKFLQTNNYPNQRFLFQVHPHPSSIRQILNQEIERLPFTRSSIQSEAEFRIKTGAIDKLGEEISLSNNCIVASSFTKNTLVENGADPNKIFIVPYGVDTVKFPYKDDKEDKRQELNVLFIGSMVQRKGLADLLLAIRILKSKKIKVTLVGHKIDRQLLKHFSDLDLKIYFKASNKILIREMHAADVFVLPSLAEGFAHVILEAMSTGLPVITTNNTAGPDLIQDGQEGFLIPIRSPDVIASKLESLLINKDLCRVMGQKAATKSRQLTWAKFRRELITHYQSCNE